MLTRLNDGVYFRSCSRDTDGSGKQEARWRLFLTERIWLKNGNLNLTLLILRPTNVVLRIPALP